MAPCSFFDEKDALREAVIAGKRSPCAKSKRGVVVFVRHYGVVADGWNHQPDPMRCDGSSACRESCAKLCIHAEEHALLYVGPAPTFAKRSIEGVPGHTHHTVLPIKPAFEVLHVKVVDGNPVPSRSPTCWQCSRTIADDPRIVAMWLLEDHGLQRYTPLEFHEMTLHNCGLPVIR